MGEGGNGSGGNVGDGERWGAADEASLARHSPPVGGLAPKRPQTNTGWVPQS